MPLATTSTQQLWFLDTLVTVRVRHDEGDDGISVLESLAPYGDSPPLHIHETEDEIFHVLEGELRVRAGDTDVGIGPGETILGPKGVPHTYRVESDGTRWLVLTRLVSVARFEDFGRALAEPQDGCADDWPSAEEATGLAGIAAVNGITVLGPPGMLPSQLEH